MNHFRRKNLLLMLMAISFCPQLLWAQESAYPQDYFRNPLNIPILLAGNFGECRPGHFHSGLDIKTGGHENEPVSAAADGYVSRIKMEPGGFGHGLYITHPNGYTTLYAHLNSFIPAIQQYVRQQQYARQSWTVDLSFTPDQFPVTKGQQIAWSGNTGSSTAPHLHFEIRDSRTEHPLNPQLFGFKIVDSIPPKPKYLAVYDLDRSLYEQEPQLVPLKKDEKENYTTVPLLVTAPSGNAGIGLVVDDYMEGSANTLAPYKLSLMMDLEPQEVITLDNIGYDETRYINAFADYKTRNQKGMWVQCLFQLPGNRLGSIYKHTGGRHGELNISDGKAHGVHMDLIDAAGNAASLYFTIKATDTPAVQAPCDTWFPPDRQNRLDDPNIRVVLPPKALYDSVCFRFSKMRDAGSYSDKYAISAAYVPVHQYFDLQIKPNKPVPFALRNKLVLVYNDGKEDEGKAAIPAEAGWYSASVRNLGTYRLVADTTGPLITSVVPVKGNLKGAKRISFTVKDKITSVKTFRGELDGAWILFEQHGSSWFYEMDAHCPEGAHTLLVKAADESGNQTVQTFTFVR